MRLLACVVMLSSVAVAAPKYEIQNNELVVPHPVRFETASARLHAEADEAIAYVKGYLDEKSYISTLRIEVHTDADGNAERNQTLSEQRALAVAKALVAKGIDCKRLVPVGFGATKPVADNRTTEGKAKNRRTVFANAALRGHAIGGAPLDGGGKPAGSPCP